MASLCYFAILIFYGTLQLITVSTTNDLKPKLYRIDLDLEPEYRWAEVINDHRDIIPAVVAETKELIPKPLQGPLFWVAERLIQFFPDDYAREIRGIANLTGLPLGEVIGINILYDITDFNRTLASSSYYNKATSSLLLGCTSIVAEDSSGHILHGRNLDYSMGSLLRNITILVDFTRNGQTLFTATTFILSVGVLTAQKPHAFTVSLNARYTGGVINNILMELITRFHQPIGFELRRTMETIDEYDEAVRHLSKEKFIAPSYLILAGAKKGQGAIITRDRWASVDVFHLNSAKGRWFLLERNEDRRTRPMSRTRKLGIRYMKAVGQARISPSTMFSVLSTPPILHGATIFTSVMSASLPDSIYQYTVIRQPQINE